MLSRPACTCAKPHFPHPSVGPWLRHQPNSHTIPHTHGTFLPLNPWVSLQSLRHFPIAAFYCPAGGLRRLSLLCETSTWPSLSFIFLPELPLLGSTRKSCQLQWPEVKLPFATAQTCCSSSNSTTHVSKGVIPAPHTHKTLKHSLVQQFPGFMLH